MPRKAKEKIEELNTEKTAKKKTVAKAKPSTSSKVAEKDSKVKKATTTKKTTSTAKTTTKKKTTSTVSTKKDAQKLKVSATSKKAKATKTAKTSTTAKATKTAKTTKSTAAKKTTKATEKKVSTTSKKGTKSSAKSSTKTVKKIATKASTRKTKKETYVTEVEYYDLPFRYNETVIKILAQTPNTLFIYWDISDDDRNKYIENYGDDFFNTTKPVLIITNQTMNYTFEIEINDFANSWYLHVNDANCDYKIELGRRPIPHSSNISTDYIYISTSNKIELPNDHILFELLGKTVFFRNVKTNIIEERSISSLSYLQRIGKIYNIYDLYKELYKDEINEDILGVNLSSSSSSTFK